MSIAPPPAALTPPHPAPPRSDAYHEDGTLNLEHGTDDPTMCKLMDSVLAGHGFGMFVLGMLCGLACAFCAYLFITRCRSQGPKMGRAHDVLRLGGGRRARRPGRRAGLGALGERARRGRRRHAQAERGGPPQGEKDGGPE